MIPKQLDSILETHDTNGALRSTILKTGPRWERQRKRNLLVDPKNNELNNKKRRVEKNKAFDLLDALSRSGALPIGHTELHVIVAVTHRFENDVMGTVVQDNVNPIEKVERSLILLASVIHGIKTNTNS